MPVYEYECLDCRIRFERKQSFTEEPIRECPECKGQTRRVLYPVGIVFKGSGFYITDSRSSATATVGGKESSNGENGSAKKGAATEAKSEPCRTCESGSETKACAARSAD